MNTLSQRSSRNGLEEIYQRGTVSAEYRVTARIAGSAARQEGKAAQSWPCLSLTPLYLARSASDGSILNITTTNSAGGRWVLDMKFAEYPRLVVRQDQQYSNTLKPGVNEIIGDVVMPNFWTPPATYHYTVEAKLPDGHTLFCFEFEYYLEGTSS